MWSAMLEAYCKLKTKPKTITNIKKNASGYLGQPATKTDQQGCERLIKLSNMMACVGARSWRWTLQTFTMAMKFWHLIIS